LNALTALVHGMEAECRQARLLPNHDCLYGAAKGIWQSGNNLLVQVE